MTDPEPQPEERGGKPKRCPGCGLYDCNGSGGLMCLPEPGAGNLQVLTEYGWETVAPSSSAAETTKADTPNSGAPTAGFGAEPATPASATGPSAAENPECEACLHYHEFGTECRAFENPSDRDGVQCDRIGMADEPAELRPLLAGLRAELATMTQRAELAQKIAEERTKERDIYRNNALFYEHRSGVHKGNCERESPDCDSCRTEFEEMESSVAESRRALSDEEEPSE